MSATGRKEGEPTGREEAAGTQRAGLGRLDEADAAVRELQQRLRSARIELREERAARKRVEARLTKLQPRRGLRVALGRAVRRTMQLQCRLRGQLSTLGWRLRDTVSAAADDGGNPVNPFVARVEAVFGRSMLDALGFAADDAPELSPQQGPAPGGASTDGGPLRVSIVMVVDEPGDVEASVHSVLQQTYPHWELFVRDCTGGKEPAPRLGGGDARVSVVRLPSTDEGVARNGGLAATRGELIAYLDPPNVWHPRFLERLIATLVEDRTRYAVFSEHIDLASAGPQRPVPQEDSDAEYAELVAQRALVLNALLHRRELYDELGGTSGKPRVGSEHDLLIKYGFVRDPGRVGAPLLLQQRTAPEYESAAGDGEASDGAVFRASAKPHVCERLPRPLERSRPALTVVSGVDALAHERAWDVAAAATEVTTTQFIGVRFGDAPPPGPRYLPAVETETLGLEGGVFPQWTSTLARCVANVHGDVVYAAEPRLPSLGLALLASAHYGTRVLADVSCSPIIQGRGREPSPACQEPLGLDAVDPRDPALLDPHSAVWDRLMAGVVSSVPCTAVGSMAAARHTAPSSLVVHHPKDEGVFDPTVQDRDAAREHLGLSPTDCVVLCGSSVWDVESMAVPHVSGTTSMLDDLSSRFRLLALTSGSPSEAAINGCVHVADRTEEEAVAMSMAASDALLLWVDPRTAQLHRALPPELGSALAMKLPVIANDVGELGALGRSGYVRLAPWGDTDAVIACLHELGHAEQRQRRSQVDAGRHLFLRQFSQAAAGVDIGVTLRMVNRDGAAPQVAEEFARFFSAFYRHAAPGRGRTA